MEDDHAHHLLVLQLLRNIARARTRNLNPSLGEHGTSRQYKGDINGGMDRVQNCFFHRVRGRHVVRNTGFGNQLRRVFHRLSMVISIKLEIRKKKDRLPPKRQPNERKSCPGTCLTTSAR